MDISGGIQASLAGRYASALFSLARDDKQLAEVEVRALRVEDRIDLIF